MRWPWQQQNEETPPHVDTGELRDLFSQVDDGTVVQFPGTTVPHAREETTPIRDKYAVNVVENIATAGLNTTAYLKYRWTVTRRADGATMKTGYGLSIRLAERQAGDWLDKRIRKGKLT